MAMTATHTVITILMMVMITITTIITITIVIIGIITVVVRAHKPPWIHLTFVMSLHDQQWNLIGGNVNGAA